MELEKPELALSLSWLPIMKPDGYKKLRSMQVAFSAIRGRKLFSNPCTLLYTETVNNENIDQTARLFSLDEE